MSKATTFSVGTTSLDQPGRWRVLAETKIHGPGEVSLASFRLPGRDGEVSLPATRTVGPSAWTVTLLIEGADMGEMLANKAALESVLYPPRAEVTVSEFSGDLGVDRQTTGTFAGTPSIEGPIGVERRYCKATYVLNVPSGTWWDGAEQLVTRGAGSRINALPSGSAPGQKVALLFTPTDSVVTIRLRDVNDPSQWVTIAGTVTPGQQVFVYPNDLTARNASTEADLSGLIDTGPTPLTITASTDLLVEALTGAPSISLTYRKAWY